MASSTLTSPDPLSPAVLSTTLSQLWIDDTESNITAVSILKTYSHICFSAIHCLIPYLQNAKIFSRILKKWDTFIPKRRFRIKIANLLVKYNLICKNLLRGRSKTIVILFIYKNLILKKIHSMNVHLLNQILLYLSTMLKISMVLQAW